MLRKLRILWLYWRTMWQIKRNQKDYCLYQSGNFSVAVWYLKHNSRWCVSIIETIDKHNNAHIDGAFTIKQYPQIWENVFKPFLKSSVISSTSLF